MSLPAALPRPAALIFDLDGTLVDTAPDLARATNELRSHHALPELSYEVIRAEVSHGGSALVRLALGHDIDHPSHAEERTRLLDFYARDVAAHSELFRAMTP
ncbi:HAD hydrolase-like protein [Cobetia marina]